MRKIGIKRASHGMVHQILVLVCVMVFAGYIVSPSDTVFAAPNIMIDDEPLSTSVSPVIEEGRVLVSLEDIANLVGGQTFFDERSGSARFFAPNARFILLDGETRVMGMPDAPEQTVAPKMTDNHLFVSIRFFADVFGWGTEWNQDTRTVILREVEGVQPQEAPIEAQAISEEVDEPDPYAAIGYVPNQDEIDLLIRLTSAEAPGEPHKGQVAVAAVVLNRVRSPRFPDTITGVINQPGQFCVVANGQINRSVASGVPAAVEEALSGSDPSQGALYFFSPSRISPSSTQTWNWINSLTILVEIGTHQFATDE